MSISESVMVDPDMNILADQSWLAGPDPEVVQRKN